MTSDPKTIVASWLAQRCGKAVDVLLGGRVFGGRHGESPQSPRAAEWEGEVLTLRFGTTETLTIVHPRGVVIGRYDALTFELADSATWEWHYYGRPQVAGNRCREHYVCVGHEVVMSSSGPMSEGDKRWPLYGEPLVKLL